MKSNIVIGSIEDSLGIYLSDNQYSKIAIVVDDNTKRDCLPIIQKIVTTQKIIELPSGEENKNIDSCQLIWQDLTDLAFDRNGLLINLGGGVIGDMGGFCAATYKRGIDFMNIPTTLLSMVDASVGGKLGVDFSHLKNQIGLFQNPSVVLIDPIFLDTLPERELRSGYAEIVKHSLIQDANLWKKLQGIDYKTLDWDSIIEHSIAIKSAVVADDPTEKGLRKILNFGHTIGHAIESFYLQHEGKKLLHGEAIAIGMICEAYLSMDRLRLSEVELIQVQKHLLEVFGKTKMESEDFDSITDLMLQDKKNNAGTIQAVLLKKIGLPKVDMPITAIETKKALKYYDSLDV